MYASLASMLKTCLITSRPMVLRLSPRVFLSKTVQSAQIEVDKASQRTVLAIMDNMKAKGLYIPPQLETNIYQVFQQFPFTPEAVENILTSHPDFLLRQTVTPALDLVTMMVELGDFVMITQEEALMWVARCPEVVQLERDKVRKQVSEMFVATAEYNLPWNSVMVASPQTILMDTRHVFFYLKELRSYFGDDQFRDLVGNNPNIFIVNISDIRDKIEYLQYVMHVSVRRIALTPNSLVHSLEFYKRRFEFLSLSGNYRPPEAGAMARKPQEAEPSLQLITDTDDRRFVNKCTGLSMEEWFVFNAMMEEAERGKELEEEEEEEDNYDDPDQESNNYIGGGRTKNKNVKKKGKKKMFK